jgi:hypothetical protein
MSSLPNLPLFLPSPMCYNAVKRKLTCELYIEAIIENGKFVPEGQLDRVVVVG